jgi:hypothetical protein
MTVVFHSPFSQDADGLTQLAGPLLATAAEVEAATKALRVVLRDHARGNNGCLYRYGKTQAIALTTTGIGATMYSFQTQKSGNLISIRRMFGSLHNQINTAATAGVAALTLKIARAYTAAGTTIQSPVGGALQTAGGYQTANNVMGTVVGGVGDTVGSVDGTAFAAFSCGQLTTAGTNIIPPMTDFFTAPPGEHPLLLDPGMGVELGIVTTNPGTSQTITVCMNVSWVEIAPDRLGDWP